jgi:surface antigen
MHAATEPFDAKPEGTQVPWSNPKTGTSGTATLVKRFTAREQECRETEYMAKSEKTSKTARYVMTLCRQPDGKWKFT